MVLIEVPHLKKSNLGQSASEEVKPRDVVRRPTAERHAAIGGAQRMA